MLKRDPIEGDPIDRAWQSGTVLAGWSAGAICWFESGLTDSFADVFAPVSGLGFLSGSCCPHYDSEDGREASFEGLIGRGESGAGYGINDGTAIHFVGEELHRVVASRDTSRVVRVEGRSPDVTVTEVVGSNGILRLAG